MFVDLIMLLLGHNLKKIMQLSIFHLSQLSIINAFEYYL